MFSQLCWRMQTGHIFLKSLASKIGCLSQGDFHLNREFLYHISELTATVDRESYLVGDEIG